MKILNLLDKPEKWIKSYLGRTKGGETTQGSDPRAVQWCLLGAVQKCYPGSRQLEAQEVIRAAITKLYPRFAPCGIATFNNDDTTTFAKIRRVLKLANL